MFLPIHWKSRIKYNKFYNENKFNYIIISNLESFKGIIIKFHIRKEELIKKTSRLLFLLSVWSIYITVVNFLLIMENEELTLIQAVRKVLSIVNKILIDNFVISENDKMWVYSISREMEEKVNMLVYYGLQSGKMPIQRNSSIRFEEMNCLQNFYVNIVAKQPFEMKYFGKT